MDEGLEERVLLLEGVVLLFEGVGSGSDSGGSVEGDLHGDMVVLELLVNISEQALLVRADVYIGYVAADFYVNDVLINSRSGLA